MTSRDKALQIHIRIPFCPRRCSHCHSSIQCGAEEETLRAYAKALLRELQSAAEGMEAYHVRCVYFQGGIPTLLAAEEITALCRAVRYYFRVDSDAEFLLDTVPGFLKEEKLHVYDDCGINRISVAIPSTNFREFSLLHCPYDISDFKQTGDLLRKHGFRNFDIHTVYGLPYQTEKTFCDTLLEAITYVPVSIRVSPLIVREASKLGELYMKYAAGESVECPPLPQAEARAAIWEAGQNMLRRYNYHPVSADSFAFAGRESRNLLHCYQGDELLGIGAGAVSYFDGYAYRNREDVQMYIAHADNLAILCAQAGTVDALAHMKYYAARNLHMAGGLALQSFEEKFGESFISVLGMEAQTLLDKGLIVEEYGYLKKTPLGIADPVQFEIVFGVET